MNAFFHCSNIVEVKVIAYDTEKKKIVGTYRLATYDTVKGNPFVTEQEFDISTIRATKENILELGRAVVHEDYRNGVVIQLLWAGMLHYAIDHNIRFVLGMGSFHGTNVTLYKHAFSYLYYNYRSPRDIASHACTTPREDMNLLEESEVDMVKVKEELPGLLRGYLRLGATVSDDIYIDTAFNSCDVLVLLDMQKISKRYIEHLMRL